jgi:hypothetical protein
MSGIAGTARWIIDRAGERAAPACGSLFVLTRGLERLFVAIAHLRRKVQSVVAVARAARVAATSASAALVKSSISGVIEAAPSS